VKKWGQLEDLEIYGVLEEEWREAANNAMHAMQRTRDKIVSDGSSKAASR